MDPLPLSPNSERESHPSPEYQLSWKAIRQKRTFIVDKNKDATYWDRRRKNNEAARHSREKSRLKEYMLERQLLALTEENARLRSELHSLKLHLGFVHSGAYLAHQLGPPPDPQTQALRSTQPIPGASSSHGAIKVDYRNPQCALVLLVWPHLLLYTPFTPGHQTFFILLLGFSLPSSFLHIFYPLGYSGPGFPSKPRISEGCNLSLGVSPFATPLLSP
ncbi:Nuclear factor interleukin-3-regulated protein [Merluccius polli]|uniref:Nuclear factor interleukin-3-regulated protein n=1 Tax=Merluccius polli TaxID=89951 RepID=A0AA47P2U5_MERPO|nr:Nuclear factor interleukin-3-regulated protein [Merluccius polli]